MNTPDFTISINPPIPVDIANECFEVQLLGRMLELTRTSLGYVVGDNARLNSQIDLSGLRRHVLGYQSPLADALRDTINAPPSGDKTVTKADIAQAMNMGRFDVEHVLQEICRLHEDRIPYFELTWSGGSGEGARRSVGAQFITPDTIRTTDPAAWLEQQRKAVSHDNFQAAMDWEQTGASRWEIKLPCRDWRQVALGLGSETVVLSGSGSSFRVRIERPGYVQDLPIGTYSTLSRAMKVGGQTAYDIETSADAAMMESMGLSPDEWEILEADAAQIMARSLIDADLSIVLGASGQMEFTLFSGTEELAVCKDPKELLRHMPGYGEAALRV